MTGAAPTRAAFATRHRKEAVVAPVLAKAGFDVRMVDVDTDAYGTFSRTVPRAGDQLQAARAKAIAALYADPDADWGLASEGALGPDPALPFLTLDVELVLARRRDGYEVVGRAARNGVGWGHGVARHLDQAREIALNLGYPEHGLVIGGPPVDGSGPARHAEAVLASWDAWERAVSLALATFGEAWLEVDGRAHRNPSRMRVIGLAAEDLASRLVSRCPACREVGFGLHRLQGAAPCVDCGGATSLASEEVRRCPACGHEQVNERLAVAGPEHCFRCNP